MRVDVTFLGIYRDFTGRRSGTYVVPEPATVANLVAVLIEAHPSLARYEADIRILRNGRGAGRAETLQAGDEIVLVDPISGGSISRGST